MNNNIICATLQSLGFELSEELNPVTRKLQNAYVVNWLNDLQMGNAALQLPPTLYKTLLLLIRELSEIIRDTTLHNWTDRKLVALGRKEMISFFGENRCKTRVVEEMLLARGTGFASSENGFTYFVNESNKQPKVPNKPNQVE